jgi:hypothetical protein
MLKPCNFGISRVKSRKGLLPTLATVFQFDIEALVEPCVKAIPEINISVAIAWRP